jgi:hypothetical protein
MKTLKWNFVHRGKAYPLQIAIKKSARVNSFTKRLQGLPGPRAEEHLYECTLMHNESFISTWHWQDVTHPDFLLKRGAEVKFCETVDLKLYVKQP